MDSRKFKLGFELTQHMRLCHQNRYDTEYPNLFVLPIEFEDFYFQKQNIDMENIKLFNYINNKFSTYEVELAGKLEDLYNKLVYMTCLCTQKSMTILLFQLILALKSLPINSKEINQEALQFWEQLLG